MNVFSRVLECASGNHNDLVIVKLNTYDANNPLEMKDSVFFQHYTFSSVVLGYKVNRARSQVNFRSLNNSTAKFFLKKFLTTKHKHFVYSFRATFSSFKSVFRGVNDRIEWSPLPQVILKHFKFVYVLNYVVETNILLEYRMCS